jgi:hypothetical protein
MVKTAISKKLRKRPAILDGGCNNSRTASHSNKTIHQATRSEAWPISGDELRTILKVSNFNNLLMAVYVKRKTKRAEMKLMISERKELIIRKIAMRMSAYNYKASKTILTEFGIEELEIRIEIDYEDLDLTELGVNPK